MKAARLHAYHDALKLDRPVAMGCFGSITFLALNVSAKCVSLGTSDGLRIWVQKSAAGGYLSS